MSADNWTQCPKCMEKDLERKKNAEKDRDEAYGKVDRIKFLELEKIANEPVKHQCCFGEWNEFHLDSDCKLFFRYYCECSNCGFKGKYENTVKLSADK